MFAGNQAGEGGTRKRDSSEEKDAEASEGVPFYVLAVSSDTGATQALSLLTCWISGWVCASADPRESPSRLASLLENVRACVLVTGGEGARLMGRNFRFPDCRVIEGESLFFEEMDETFLSALSSVDHSASASPSLPPPVLRCTAEAVRVDRPSHVFFTSGSTGMPKGCLVGHNAVASYAAERSARQGVATVGRAAWRLCVEMKGRSGGSIVERGGEVTETEREREREREREGGRFLCVSPPSFDPSLGDVAQAWLGVCRRSGRSSCLLLPPSYPSVLGGLSSMLKDLNVTHLTTTPTLWRTLQYGSGGGLGEGGKKSGCPVLFSLQDVALGGEKMGLDIVEVFSGSRTRLWNVYGVTECAVYQTALEVQTCERGIPLRRDGMPGGETGSGPPLGKFSSASCCGLPLESVGVGTVREESGGESEEGSGVCELLPFGTVGEVILWGPQVGLGYVGLPSETRRAFVSLDIGGCGGAVGRSLNGACGRGQYVRAYRTGDLGWVDETSGELWLIGRGGGVNGDQVKVRGQRVELSEVEASCCSMFQEAEGILRDQRVREWCDQLGIRHASLFEVGGVAAVLVETGGGVAASQPSPQDPVGVEKTDVVSLGRGRGGQLGMLCCLRRVDDDDDDDARERTREAPVLSSENISQMREGGSGTSHLTSSPSSVQLPATTNRHLPACLGKALLFMCARLLPTHLRPQRVVVANADLPKTISGKVDRPSATRMFAELARQERELEETASEGGDAGGDWTETEKIVAVCWALYVGLVPEGSVDSRKKFDETMKLVCGRGMIKREDHFDQLGGDSMTALRVVRRLRGWAAGRDFPPREAGGEFGEFSGPLSPQALVELASLSLFSLFLEKNKIKLRPPQLRENEEGDETGEAVDREEKGGREKETKKKHSGRNTPPTSSQGLEENSTESVSLEEKEKGKGKEASRDGEDESKAPAPAARETTTETPEKKNRGDATADLFFSLLRSVCGKGDFLSLALLLSLRGEKWGRSLLRADSDDDLSKKLDALFPLDSQPSPSNDQRRAASPSPLHLACLGGHSLCCLLLLLSGASPSLCDARRATPLHLAAAAGPKGTACVRALLAAECAEREGMPGPLPMGPGVRSNRKKFVLAIRDESEHTVVHAAARGGSAESVELICASWMKASPPYRLTHATISASRKGEAEARGESSSSDGVSRLRTLDWRDRWGRTPVHWAVVNCQPQALAALLKCGADPDPLALPEGKARHQTSLRIERPIEVARRLSISGRSLPPPPSEEGTSVEGRFSGLVSPVAQSFVTQDGGQEREKEQVEESWQEDESKIEFARKGEEKTTANDVKSEIGDATALQADARLTAKDERRLGAEMLSVFENHAHRTR
uniref:AMP-dependent synthetase/ligase domain-containing protein n=1 Tax=Chromera velia CCMP2878 TaxID=1169474 RepID=A0A0G4GP81_9ALVE|eukprot:Cvel_22784.t1-p1 / transcript=Cvel_22784.t1 / gene=Cvel_22784 / organism=Chromera_velia_CCMP2878 / gene_product=Nonribosomal peptide synthetase 13, putative / transcript_product=Nonribosomal peptide synthetase 13, putative / location=Cvel_scaffold2278:27147-31223(-) / protein_length=1359 / sequence_SO=supercontig / SO=protein_coding / is_pseudo=false